MEGAAQQALSFAGLLRQLRAEARLTQEELAEAAGLSPRSISDLERGINRTARKETAVLLAGALGLDGQVRTLFVAAARGRAPACEVLTARDEVPPSPSAVAATRALPRDIGSFTGRQPELARLLAGVAADGVLGGIHAIDGMAGSGKTTLAVHAAHRLAARFPDGQFFLPLHAHTPGQQPVSPADALASLLLTAGVAVHDIPPGREARASRWRDHVAGKKILLVLDDAAGHEQIRPLLPGSSGSLVLITSRRRLTALEDAGVVSIDTLPPGDAIALLARLAGRADLAIAGGPAADIARMCGYLPLAIGMLARQLRHHPARDPTELARELAATHDRLAVMRAENLSVAAAFDLSYQDLTPAQQRLFRRLGPAPGTDIDAYAAAALDDVSLETARAQLDELYDQHLITEPAPGRYLLHDLLREHARTLAEADAGDSRAAVRRLVNYYAYVAAVASRQIATWTTGGGRLPPSRPPVWVPELPGSEQAAGWLEAERANLHAAAQQAEAGAMPQHAITIASAMGGFLRARGHWDQAAELYQTALNAAAGAGDVAGQAGALDELGLLQQITGNYPAASASLSRAAGLYRDVGDLSGQAYALNHLGLVQQDLSDYPAQAASHRQALDLARRSGDELAAAVSLVDLGQLQQWTGEYAAAVGNTEEALAVFRRLGSRFDEADALCQLGFARCLMGDHETATTLHGQALDLYRRVGDRLGQAWAHAGLGLVQMATGDYPAAASSLGLSLRTHLDLGSRHGQACTLNYLGELAGLTKATEVSRERHGRALAIARDLGAPLEEARALEGMGRSYLHSDPDEATAHLRRALAIYQRIGNPGALRTQAALDELGHRGP